LAEECHFKHGQPCLALVEKHSSKGFSPAKALRQSVTGCKQATYPFLTRKVLLASHADAPQPVALADWLVVPFSAPTPSLPSPILAPVAVAATVSAGQFLFRTPYDFCGIRYLNTMIFGEYGHFFVLFFKVPASERWQSLYLMKAHKQGHKIAPQNHFTHQQLLESSWASLSLHCFGTRLRLALGV
jgi:hypothetical protein